MIVCKCKFPSLASRHLHFPGLLHHLVLVLRPRPILLQREQGALYEMAALFHLREKRPSLDGFVLPSFPWWQSPTLFLGRGKAFSSLGELRHIAVRHHPAKKYRGLAMGRSHPHACNERAPWTGVYLADCDTIPANRPESCRCRCRVFSEARNTSSKFPLPLALILARQFSSLGVFPLSDHRQPYIHARLRKAWRRSFGLFPKQFV